jgi:hypothetical protein
MHLKGGSCSSSGGRCHVLLQHWCTATCICLNDSADLLGACSACTATHTMPHGMGHMAPRLQIPWCGHPSNGATI